MRKSLTFAEALDVARSLGLAPFASCRAPMFLSQRRRRHWLLGTGMSCGSSPSALRSDHSSGGMGSDICSTERDTSNGDLQPAMTVAMLAHLRGI